MTLKNQKFTYAELTEMQNWSLEQKILRAQQLVFSEIKKSKKPVVSCSFGKDSMVVLHLVRLICKKALVVFHNTLVEYPETYEYRDLILKEWNIENYLETKPVKTFWECVKEYGFPQYRHMNHTKGGKRPHQPKCCRWMKEIPIKRFFKKNDVDANFIGLQASESMVRRLSFFREGEVFNSRTYKVRIVRPLMIWKDSDIWGYHKKYKIPYNPIYDKMPRNGCMPCTGFKNWRERLAEYNPRMYRYISNQLGQPLIDDFIKKVPC